MSGVAGGTSMDANVGGNIAANAATNNFLKHDQATAMQKEFDQCKAKKGGCSDADYVGIRNKYLSLSNQNIAKVEGCITNGDVACVKNLESQAASGNEISNQLVTVDRTNFINRQNNIVENGSIKGAYSLFGTDVQQAQQVADFKQANCVNLSASVCSGLVKQALNDRLERVGVLGLAGFGASLAGTGLAKLKLPGSRATGVPISDVVAEPSTAKGANTVEEFSTAHTSLADALKFRQRTLELGYDAARDQMLVREGIGAARFENATGRTVTRTVDGAVDFHDSVLGNFDLKGPILANDGTAVAITAERVQGLAKSAIKEANFSTASKAVVVDTMGMTSEQIATLKATVANGVKSTKPIIYIH